MKYSVKYNALGAIVYDESIWTGRKKIYVNGNELKKTAKNTFEYVNADGLAMPVYISGNILTGVKLTYKGECVRITPQTKWYEIALFVFMIVFNLVWGNNQYLVTVIPMVGGAIGAVIACLCAFVFIIASKSVKKVWIKLLIFLGCFVFECLLAFAVAYIIIAIAASAA